jgi:protein-glutamine gamma-glutamyltransferase
MESGPGFVMFDDYFTPGPGIDSAPTADDLQLPEREVAALVQVAAGLGLDAHQPEAALRTLGAFFQDRFRYSLGPASGTRAQTNTSPLSAFLLEHRSGHCEYFATAGVLLLRKAGIPARYAAGYAVQERAGRGYVVRQRHAHAWCLAYHDGAWRDFDPTPASFWAREAAAASRLEFLSDAWSRLWFELTKFRYGQSNLRRYLLWLVLPLLLVSLWRLVTGKQWKRFRLRSGSARGPLSRPGQDSELYEVERALVAAGLVRTPSESLGTWFRRIRSTPVVAANEAAFEALVQLHCRYRFDPDGLDPGERARLRRQAESCLEALRTERGVRRRTGDGAS